MKNLRQHALRGVLIVGGAAAILVQYGCASTNSGQAAATGALWGAGGGAIVKGLLSPQAALVDYAVPMAIGAVAGAVTGIIVAESVALFDDSQPVIYPATQPQVVGVAPMAPVVQDAPLVIPSTVAGDWNVYELSGDEYEAVHISDSSQVWHSPPERNAFCIKEVWGRQWSPEKRSQCF